MKIIKALLDLKMAFVEQDGELLEITLDKKATEALERECLAPSDIIPCSGICPLWLKVPHCFIVLNDRMILGIKIRKKE